jgi:hypothetical protein
VFGVSAAGLLGLGVLLEAFQGVLPDQLQHTVARLAAPLRHRDQRLVDQAREQVQDPLWPNALPGANRLCRLQGETTGEYREPPKEGALVLAQELVAPVYGSPERPLARLCRAAAPCEQAERVFEAG